MSDDKQPLDVILKKAEGKQLQIRDAGSHLDHLPVDPNSPPGRPRFLASTYSGELRKR